MDVCYPKPPHDIFERMLAMYRDGDPIYTVEHDQQVVGCVYCARHSKGGHLESLAVAPGFRVLGLADGLVQMLLSDNAGVISLTTRIQTYFERFGFTAIRDLEDGSIFMIHTEQESLN